MYTNSILVILLLHRVATTNSGKEYASRQRINIPYGHFVQLKIFTKKRLQIVQVNKLASPYCGNV